MIKFKNINGDVFLAVGSVKRKSALNGEKSLSATITQGDDVLNKIDKGWSLEFDNEPYVVTYFERNDNNNTVEIDAIHKFFWDMTKSVLYNSYSNSHVARFYLDEIFKDTGYTYALNFDPKAFEKENWGMKNKLGLFNDAISSMGAEFEINGTLISIFKNVGSDLSTIVRHGFNLSDMTLENDNTNFATYGEGFGAYDDKENQKGPRLHVTYTSPLAKAFGKLHAEPIVDERYTVKDNLLSAVKDKVDSSFAVSVKLSLYDLTAAGYPYKMANVGDWLLAVDENLDFKQKIRIISVDDEFAEDGTRISYTVTCGDVGVAKKYQDTNASLSQKVQSAYDNAQAAKESAIQAVISSTGKNTNYWFDSVDEMNAFQGNEGDLAFVQIGDGQAMYVYTKMPDSSFKWVKRLDPDTGEQIAAGVEEAISTANKHTDELNEKQASEAAAFQSEANIALSSAAVERADMFKQSTSMATSAATHADSMANSAAAYGKAQAASALSSANSALTTAKSDLTTAIGRETEDRNKAVSAVNSQAQDYATQAKSDAIEAAKIADGQVRKDFKETTDALSSTISQNKSDAEGKISTAQATATQALDGLAFKVSKTDYDQKTGDLSTKINDVKQTADSSAQTIADIKIADGKQDTRMSEIENTANGLKSTVSDLSTTQGKQSGYISELQQRADGFDATVTKVNNLSVGGRNLLLATSVTRTGVGNNSINGNFNAQGASWNLAGGKKVSDIYNQYGSSGYLTISFDWVASGSTISGTFDPIWNNTPWGGLAIAGGINPSNTNTSGHYENTVSLRANGYSTGTATAIILRQDNLQGNITVTNMKLESGNVATDWSPAPEDVDSATAKAQLTADKANLDLSTYKTDANGRISKAQADITATSKEVSTKVSQSDFDKKTGDLTTKYGQVKTTADAVTTDVANYKKSNDGKVSANTASINTLNNQITSKVSQTDYDKETKDLEGKYSETKQTVDSISQTVTELQAKANAQGQVNQLMNTEFNPDLEGWITDSVGRAPYRSYFDTTVNKVTVGFNTQNNDIAVSMLSQKVALASTPGARGTISLSWQARSTDGSTGTQTVSMSFVDSSGNTIGKSITADWTDRGTGWNIKKIEGINIPDKATSVTVAFIVSEKVTAYLAKPMLVFDATIGDYVPGNYNNNARVAAVELGIDHITGLVNDPKNGLSATATLAANGLSVAAKAQTAASTADGKAVAAQELATTANTTANGTQTTITNFQKDVKDLKSTITKTAGQVTTEIEDRKNGDNTTRTQLTNLIDQRVKETKSGYESAISQSADKIMLGVAMQNQLFNTAFSPDFDGWLLNNNGAGGYHNNFFRSYLNNGDTVVGVNTASVNVDGNATKFYSYLEQDVGLPGNNSGTPVSLSWDSTTNLQNNYSNLFVQFKNADGSTISTVNTRWDSPVGEGWQHHTWNNISVPTNAHHIRVSFQTREGATVYLKRPMLTFTYQAQDYMPGSYSGMNSSTVLQLFKDNWGIGLADNVGKITSGIIGDKNSLNLINNNIVLQGNTTVTADFYAKGGNFKNLNASNITTGTINAAKINVINLDVSSLSGNITNFIKSYWSDAYSNQVVVNANNVSFYTNSHRSSTVISEGQIDMTVYNNTTKIPEHIGGLKHGTVVGRDNQDYLIMYLDGWKTQGGHPADAAKHGGDGFMFSVSDGWNIPTGMPLLTWENELLAGGAKHLPGWHFWDHTEFHSDVMMFPNGAYQGLYFGATEYNGTTYPGIFGNQKQDDGPGILFGSTELYFLYKNTVYPLSVVLKAASGGW
ncbi:phage tail protein [Weissella sagaensis]|uniref:phage tail protein n=1 Tax=Weissella sagaensis TaxID=2559928 RepID=UPI0013EA05C9|nr:phage tail protein [Weissella sagaensis]